MSGVWCEQTCLRCLVRADLMSEVWWCVLRADLMSGEWWCVLRADLMSGGSVV
jgi:hypothetical protein